MHIHVCVAFAVCLNCLIYPPNMQLCTHLYTNISAIWHQLITKTYSDQVKILPPPPPSQLPCPGLTPQHHTTLALHCGCKSTVQCSSSVPTPRSVSGRQWSHNSSYRSLLWPFPCSWPGPYCSMMMPVIARGVWD